MVFKVDFGKAEKPSSGYSVAWQIEIGENIYINLLNSFTDSTNAPKQVQLAEQCFSWRRIGRECLKLQ